VGAPAGAFTLLITVISLASTSLAQIVAISTGLYYIDTRLSKLCALSPPVFARAFAWAAFRHAACLTL
jgi:hypothetical protein